MTEIRRKKERRDVNKLVIKKLLNNCLTRAMYNLAPEDDYSLSRLNFLKIINYMPSFRYACRISLVIKHVNSLHFCLLRGFHGAYNLILD